MFNIRDHDQLVALANTTNYELPGAFTNLQIIMPLSLMNTFVPVHG